MTSFWGGGCFHPRGRRPVERRLLSVATVGVHIRRPRALLPVRPQDLEAEPSRPAHLCALRLREVAAVSDRQDRAPGVVVFYVAVGSVHLFLSQLVIWDGRDPLRALYFLAFGTFCIWMVK